jgi:lysylphosphatidylglycerol synthetase-like protein (DUF2156 family)
MRVPARYARDHPFSVAIAAAILVTGVVWAAPRTAATRLLAAGPVTTGEEHRWWTPFTALVVPSSLLEAALTAAAALTVMAYIERVIGTTRTVLAYVGVGVVAILAGIGLHLLLTSAGAPVLIGSRPALTLDPAIGVFAVLMTGSAFAPTLFRRRIRIVGFAVVLVFALYGGDQDSVYRLIAALLGLGLGGLLRRGMPVQPRARPARRTWRRMSFGEVRAIVAALVAVTGIGPVIALLDGTLNGPLALVVSGYAQIEPHSAYGRCAVAFRAGCDADPVHAVARTASAVLLSLAPVAVALVAAWGLRAGRRAGWVTALATNGVSIVVTAAAVGIVGVLSPAGSARVGERFALAAVLAVGVPAAVIVVLVLTRRRFALRTTAGAARRFAWTVGVALAAAMAVWAAPGLATGQFGLPLGFRVIADRFLGVLLPPGIGRALPGATAHVHGILSFVSAWTGVAFWLTTTVALVQLLRAPDEHDDRDARRYRELLREFGGGTMGMMGTWAGMQHWIAADESAAVAYRRDSGIALTIGDPVCAPGREGEAIDGFTRHCDRRGLTPVFYSIHEPAFESLRARGWRGVPVAEETVVRLPGLVFAGGRWKRVRQALAKADRAGIRAVWTRWDDLPAALARQIEVLSEQWVAEKALPELGFTLGGLAELRDPDVALLLAVDADERLHAVTSWMPVWRGHAEVGWTLDFMRRDDSAMPDIMVFLIASAALRMRDAGLSVMSLSGAPLVAKPQPTEGGGLEPEPPASLLARQLAWLAEVLEPAYGFRSLFEFKQKFHPELRTLHLAYADAASLPAAARAILRAYLPAASARAVVRLLRRLAPRS